MPALLRLIGLAAIVLSSAFGAVAAAQEYPQVGAIDKTFDILDVADANVALSILSLSNQPLYELQCHSADYGGDQSFDYSGDFECRLSSSGDHDAFSTLLTEDQNQSRDWESRARFFAFQLKGACALIPDFGAERTFRLRGMVLTLAIHDPRFNMDGKLKSLKLRVAVRPDTSARRAIAAIVPIPNSEVAKTCKLREYFHDAASE